MCAQRWGRLSLFEKFFFLFYKHQPCTTNHWCVTIHMVFMHVHIFLKHVLSIKKLYYISTSEENMPHFKWWLWLSCTAGCCLSEIFQNVQPFWFQSTYEQINVNAANQQHYWPLAPRIPTIKSFSFSEIYLVFFSTNSQENISFSVATGNQTSGDSTWSEVHWTHLMTVTYGLEFSLCHIKKTNTG